MRADLPTIPFSWSAGPLPMGAAASPCVTVAPPSRVPEAPTPVDRHESVETPDDLPYATLGQRIHGLDFAHPIFLQHFLTAEFGGSIIGAIGGALLGHPALGAAVGGAIAAGALAAYGVYAGRLAGDQLEHPENYHRGAAFAAGGAPAAAGAGAQQPTFSPRDPDGPTPADLGWDYTDVTFTSHETPLSGWYIPAAQPSDKTVIFVQGHNSDKRDFLERHCKMLREKYNVLTFDLRNQGESGGATTTMGYYERDDVLAAIDLVRSRFGASEVGLLGLSMGAATVLEAAAASPFVKAVVADSPYESVAYQVSDVARKRGYPLPDFVGWAASAKVGWDVGGRLRYRDPFEAVPEMTQHVLFIHGDADEYVLPYNSELLFATRPWNSARWLVKGAGHVQSDLVAGDEYAQRVHDFFDKNL